MDWEIGIDIYTLFCIKQVTSENLLNSKRNSTQSSVVTDVGRKRGSKYTCGYAIQQKHNIIKQVYFNKNLFFF